MATLEVDINYTGVYDRDRHYRGIYLPVDSSDSFNLVYRFKLTGPAVVTVKLIAKDPNGNIVKTLTVTEDWSYLQDEWVYTYNAEQFGTFNLSALGGDDLFLTWQFYLDGQLHTEFEDLVHVINASKVVQLGYIEIVEVGAKTCIETDYGIVGWYAVEGQNIPMCKPGYPFPIASDMCPGTVRAVIVSKLPEVGDRGFRIKLKSGSPGFMDDIAYVVIKPGLNIITGSDYIAREDFRVQIYFYYDYYSDNSILIKEALFGDAIYSGCDAYPTDPPTYTSDISITEFNIPTSIVAGEWFSVSVTVKNSGNVSDYVVIKIPTFAIETEIFLNAGETKTIDFGKNFAFTQDGVYNICVTANDDEVCKTVTVSPSEAKIEITDMFTGFDTVYAGDIVTLTVKLTNNGGSTGTKTLVITVNGTEFTRESITLEPLRSTIKTYDIQATTPGLMTICAEVV